VSAGTVPYSQTVNDKDTVPYS